MDKPEVDRSTTNDGDSWLETSEMATHGYAGEGGEKEGDKGGDEEEEEEEEEEDGSNSDDGLNVYIDNNK